MKKPLLAFISFIMLFTLSGCVNPEKEETTKESIKLEVPNHPNGSRVTTDENGNFELKGTTYPETAIYVLLQDEETKKGLEDWIKSDKDGNFTYTVKGLSKGDLIKLALSTDVELDGNNVGLKENAKSAYELEVYYPK